MPADRLAARVQQVLEDPTILPTAAAPPAAAVTPTEPTAAPTPTVAEAASPTAPSPTAPEPPAVAAADAAPAAVAPPPEAAKSAPVAAPEDTAAKAAKEPKEPKDGKEPKESKESREPKDAKAAKEPKEAADLKAGKDPLGGDVAVPEGADATDLYYGGKRKLDHGDFAGAIADLRASHKIRPSVRTLTLLGRAYFDSDQLGAAEKAFKAAGTYDEAMLLLGQLYQQSGKADKARKVYDKFLAAHPDHPKAEWVRKLLQTL